MQQESKIDRYRRWFINYMKEEIEHAKKVYLRIAGEKETEKCVNRLYEYYLEY